MIILHVTYVMNPGEKENFLTAIKAAKIDLATRNEIGCLQYDFFYAAQNDDKVLLVEKWETIDALNAHVKMPHYKCLADLKLKYVKSTTVEKYIGECI